MSVMPYIEPERRDWIAVLPKAAELAKAVANTDFVPKSLRNNPAAITAAILYGDEIGLGPMRALAYIAVIDGRPSLAAEAMRGLVLAAGHEMWVEEATNTKVTVGGRRRESEQVSRVTWTMDDAKRAGLVNKDNWRKYPRAMLTNRASAELARAIFADAIGGMDITDDIEDGPDEAAAVAVEGPSGHRRRRRATLAPVSAQPADVPDEPTPPLPPLPGEELASEPGPETAGTGDAPGPSDADTPAQDAGLITEQQIPRWMAAYREAGFTTREGRLAYATLLVGRAVTTSKELTEEEASRLIESLEHHTEARASARADAEAHDAP